MRLRFLPVLLLVALVLGLSAGVSAQDIALAHPPPPALWQHEDTAAPIRRYAVETARFPSVALAESVRAGLVNMGWAPVYLARDGDETRVLLGNFASIGESAYFAEELTAQSIAEAHSFVLPPSVKAPDESATGPLWPPYTPTPKKGEKPEAWMGSLDAALNDLRSYRDAASVSDTQTLDESIAKLTAETEIEKRGPAAALLAGLLVKDRKYPEAALFLAGKVARGEWTADPAARLQCAEAVADLLYGHRRDWRGAWASTRALLADPNRDRDGRTRDRLRQVALLVDLAAMNRDPRPTWPDIRAAIRKAHDGAGAEDRQSLAKAELLYMETFAWEGRWDRVELLARDVVQRYPQHRPETALARIFHARSLERKQDWNTALDQLDLVIQMDIPPETSLAMGFEPLDLRAIARTERQRISGLAAGVEEEKKEAEKTAEDAAAATQPATAQP